MLLDSLSGFQNWSVSDYAAWWGAVVATVAVGWNIFSATRSGPRIKVKALSGVKYVPGTPATQGKTFVSVTAINVGKRATTITHFGGYGCKSLFASFRTRHQHHFVSNAHQSLGSPLPFVLQPGEEWRNALDQQQLRNLPSSEVLYVGVIHNQRKKPVYVRVKLA